MTKAGTWNALADTARSCLPKGDLRSAWAATFILQTSICPLWEYTRIIFGHIVDDFVARAVQSSDMSNICCDSTCYSAVLELTSYMLLDTSGGIILTKPSPECRGTMKWRNFILCTTWYTGHKLLKLREVDLTIIVAIDSRDHSPTILYFHSEIDA